MHFLAVFSLRNRALIALVTIAAAVFGGLALTSLKQELIPSITFPQLAIVSSYPGAAPEVVNQDVSNPIEAAIQGVPGLDSTVTTSSTNLSVVNATFTYETNLDTAEAKLTSAINRIRSLLPDGVDPQVLRFSFDDFPVIQIAVSGGDTKALAAQLNASVIPKLEKIDGVREASLVGAVGQRVAITPDPAALAARGLTTGAITQAMSANGTLIPAGTVTEDDLTYSVLAGSKLASVDDIASLPLIGVAGVPTAEVTTIGDVATVALVDDPVTSYSLVNGEDALTIAVTKLPSANTVDVSKAVTAMLPELESSVPGATFTVVFDQAPFIQQSIDSLATEGLLGLVFAVLVILVFLLSVRATLVTAISIPTSVLITFIGLQASGYTLNIITLGALTIAIGRVVDDSIVVIENIKRHLEYGEEKLVAIQRAVKEVAGAITASTATTVAVFLPISFVGGSTGELFRPFALTVTIALVSSLLVSLTIVPVLAYWFLRPSKKAREAHARHAAHAAVAPAVASGGLYPDELDEAPSRLQRGYLPIIRWTLKHAVVTIVVAVLILGGTLALVPFMKTNFLGSSGQNTFTVTQTVPVGTSLDAQLTIAKDTGDVIGATDGVETVQVSIGTSGSALRDAFAGGGDGAITYSVTTDPDADQTVVQDDVRKDLEQTTSADDISISGGAGLGNSDILINVTAPDQKTLEVAAKDVYDAVNSLDGIKQAESNLAATRPYVAVTVNRDSAAELGLSEIQISSLVSRAMLPTGVGSVEIASNSYTVYLQTEDVPATTTELSALPIPTARGPVPLSTVATVAQADGPASITSVGGQRSATISVTPDDDNLGTATTEIQTAIDGVDLPAGAQAELGGVASDQSEAFSQLGIALLAAILIVYIIMVATFKSLLQPLLLLVSVPFAATGAIALQVITGIPLGVASLIGVLMLIGIVVTNAIVLVDLVNQYRERGRNVHDALIQGAGRRLRPILMTALATIFALLPMAVGLTGHGGFISQPLAIVVIGGLVSSTVLTLIVLPVLYSVVEGPRERRRLKREGRLTATEAATAPEPTAEPATATAPTPE